MVGPQVAYRWTPSSSLEPLTGAASIYTPARGRTAEDLVAEETEAPLRPTLAGSSKAEDRLVRAEGSGSWPR